MKMQRANVMRYVLVFMVFVVTESVPEYVV